MVLMSECRDILVVLAVLFVVACAISPVLAAIPTVLTAFTLYFFRDPERHPPVAEGAVLSPADGTVLGVEDVEDDYVGRSRRISIFMSPLNVHVNRSPIDGIVESVRHTPGRKVAAYLRGDLDARERNRIEISGGFKVVVEQYAGVIARRIVCFVSPGMKISGGERIGIIKFGSRADVIMPLSISVKVAKGAKVAAGESILGVSNG